MRNPKPKDKRLYWRGGKLWCRVPGPAGRIVRKTTRCTDEVAASAKADEFERRYADPTHAAAAAAQLEGAVRAYIKDLDRRGRSQTTKEIAAQKCGHFLRLWGRDLTMLELAERGAQMVLEYIDTRKSEGVVQFTVKKELGHLSQVLRIARYLGVFRRDPVELFPPFFSGEHTPRTRAPKMEEFHKLLAELALDRAAHLTFIAATGGRRKESFLAERTDVDFARGVVRLRGTKTKKAKGDVPITRITRPMLEWALANAPGKVVLFRRWENLWRDVAAACVRAEIAKVTPNDLRRAFASWHRDALARTHGDKTAAEIVSKLLRHTTDKLAQTTYADLPAEAIGAAIEQRLQGVPELYLEAAFTAPTAALLRAPESQNTVENAAPPAEVESATFGLGSPLSSLGRNRRSAGTKKGIQRAKERAAGALDVPEVYLGGDSSADPPGGDDPPPGPLPPGLEATRVEVDGRSATVGVLPGDTQQTLSARVAQTLSALAAGGAS